MATSPVYPGVIAVDLADVWATPARKRLLRTLVWGDALGVRAITATRVEVELPVHRSQPDGSLVTTLQTGYIVPTKASGLAPADVVKPAAENRVLKLHMVDVQQGDGLLVETPAGQVMLVDGGDNQLFARYLASVYRGTNPARPLEVACMLVTHGDADHFAGLAEIEASETHTEARKRLFIRPHRVFHNGLVKRAATSATGKPVAETRQLGPTRRTGKGLFLTGLTSDLLAVPDSKMNLPFRRWKAALARWQAQRGPIEFRRLAFGDDAAFAFLAAEGLQVQVLGPHTTTVGGKPALPFLGTPARGPRTADEVNRTAAGGGSPSASHTINGHSVVLRLVYGGFSWLLAGDLNDEAGRTLARAAGEGRLTLRSEVFKVPHHGSADFSGAFLQAVAPLVSLVSSGDESARKEYIHPRATLMAALGRASRGAEPLVFVTELVAFFQMEGWSRLTDAAKAKARGTFFGFSRAAFGLVKTRSDGQRLLVVTDSANVAMKEAYAFTLDAQGQPQGAPVRRA